MYVFTSCSEDHPDTSPMNRIQQFSCFRNHIQGLARGLASLCTGHALGTGASVSKTSVRGTPAEIVIHVMRDVIGDIPAFVVLRVSFKSRAAPGPSERSSRG